MSNPFNGEFVKSKTEIPRPNRVQLQSNMHEQCQHQWVHEMQCGSYCACREDDFYENRKTKPSCFQDSGSDEGSVQCICLVCSLHFAL